MKKKVLALLMTAVLVLGMAACGQKESEVKSEKDAKAVTMRLAKTEGNVSVEDAEEASVKLRENLKLYDGYSVATGQESYAWIDLDDVKLTKMDSESKVTVHKDGKDLKMVVNSGNLYFHVTQPLGDDETMNICTSSMIMGIRGTEGWVEVPEEDRMRVNLLEGKVECSILDDNGNVMTSVEIKAGETADMVYAGDGSAITVGQLTTVPAFVQKETNHSDEQTEAGDGQVGANPSDEQTGTDGGQKKAEFVPWAEAGKTDHVMDWQDPNLEAAMREVTGITDRDIMLSDVWEMPQLSLHRKEVSNITALAELTNLERLELRENPISDITAVSGLTNLGYLGIDSQVGDIKALAGLTNLYHLILTHAQINDISVLSGLTNMKRLDLSENQINDITALSGLTKLETLYLSHNQISNISALSNLTKLGDLFIQGNPVADYSPLDGLPNLKLHRDE